MKISKNAIYILFILLPFFKPTLLSYKEGFIDNVFNVYMIVVTIFVMLQIYIKKERISKIVFLIIVYEVFRIVSNILNGLSVNELLAYVIRISSFSIVFDFLIKKDAEKTITIINKILFLSLIINMISYKYNILMFSTNIYFLGMRTRFTDLAYPLIVLAFLENRINSNKIKLILYNIIAIFNILMASVSTGIIGIAIFYIMLILYKFNILKKIYGYFKILIVSIATNVSIVFFRIQNIFRFIIEELLHKNLDLTGRTEIWDNAISQINIYKMVGEGFYNNRSICKL